VFCKKDTIELVSLPDTSVVLEVIIGTAWLEDDDKVATDEEVSYATALEVVVVALMVFEVLESLRSM
jgi:hypothetical protein